MLHDTYYDRMGTWWMGYFRESNSVGFAQGTGGDAFTARATRLIRYIDDGRCLTHVGMAYSHRTFQENQARFRNRPESNLSLRLVDTGVFATDTTDLFAFELAHVVGPTTLQAEYIHNISNTPVGQDLHFSAYYVTLKTILTGEAQDYSRSRGVFRRVEPKRNFAWKDGCYEGYGALELAGRFSHVDLTDGSINGGRQTNWTLGLNWYLNPNTRAMFNFVRANRHDIGDMQIFQSRLQIDF